MIKIGRFYHISTLFVSLIFGAACPVEDPKDFKSCIEAGAQPNYCCEQVFDKGTATKQDIKFCGCLKENADNVMACCKVELHEICLDDSTAGDTTQDDSTTQDGDTALDNPTTSTTTGMTFDLPDDPTTSTTSTSTAGTTGDEETGDSSSTGGQCQQLGTEGCGCYGGECFAPLSCVEGECQCVLGSGGCSCYKGECFGGLVCEEGVCVETEQFQPSRPQM